MPLPSPFTVEEFRDWAAQQPAEERYQYFDNCGCAMARFLIAKGYTSKPLVGGEDWDQGETDEVFEIPRRLIKPLSGNPETFGALVERIDATA